MEQRLRNGNAKYPRVARLRESKAAREAAENAAANNAEVQRTLVEEVKLAETTVAMGNVRNFNRLFH